MVDTRTSLQKEGAAAGTSAGDEQTVDLQAILAQMTAMSDRVAKLEADKVQAEAAKDKAEADKAQLAAANAELQKALTSALQSGQGEKSFQFFLCLFCNLLCRLVSPLLFFLRLLFVAASAYR